MQMTYTADDLKKLPLRAIVAFAARCARRVEHLALPPDGHPEEERWPRRSRRRSQVAEDFARGLPCPTAESAVLAVEAGQEAAQGDLSRENAYAAVVRTAHATATAIHAIAVREEPPEKPLVSGSPTISPACRTWRTSRPTWPRWGPITAAMDAAEAVASTDEFTLWAALDYRKLLELKLGEYPEAGQPIDPSPEGPLGPLRPEAAGP